MLILDRTLDPDAVTLINRMTVPPPREREDLIHNTIRRLKDGHVWPKLDMLQIYSAHTAQAALLNWKSTNFTATETNSPTFTSDVGYTSATTGIKQINSQYNPTTAGNKYLQNNNYMAAWLLDDQFGSTSAIGWFSGDGSSLNNNTAASGTTTHRSNSVAATTGAAGSGSGRGFWSVVRDSSTTTAIRKNAVQVTAGSATSAALRNLTMIVGGTSAAGSRDGLFGGVCAGAFLTTDEEVILYQVTRDYMLAVKAATGI